MKGSITKLSRNKNAVRSKCMEGIFTTPPTVGRSFFIFGDPIDPTAFARVIGTSPVVSIKEEKSGWVIQTENSKYRIIRED